MRFIKEHFCIFLSSLLSTLAFCYLCSINVTNVFIFLLSFFGILFFFVKNENRKDNNITALSIVLCFLLMLGKYSVFLYESTGIELAAKLLITPIGFYIFSKRFFIYLFEIISDIKISNKKELSTKFVFVISFAVIIISWIPAWIAEYPAIIPADTMAQINQAFGIYNLNNANPLIHTLFLRFLFYILSFFTANINKTVFIVSLIQMIINSLIYALVITYIYKKTKSKLLCVFSLLFYSIVSYNVFFNITISKDSAYAAFLSLFIVSIDKYCGESSMKNLLQLIAIGILYSLMRSNGYYTLLFVLAVVLAYTLKKRYKKFMITLLITFLLSSIIRFPVYNIVMNNENKNYNNIVVKTNTKIGNNGYRFVGSFLYVVPFQQVANVVAHGRELNEKEEWLIEEYIPLEMVGDVYNPILVDPLFSYIENHFQSSRGDISNIEYIKLWVELFLKYPMDYVEAYVNMNKYYFYPSRFVNMYVTNICENELGIAYDGTISKEYKETIERIYDYQKDIPFFGPLYCPGVVTFILIISLFYTFKRNNESFMCLLPLLGNLLVLMAFVPLNDEFRYIYPIVACLPLIIMMFIKNNEKIEGEKYEL